MLNFSPIKTKSGTIRDVLLSARDAMLPEILANDPLAKWILSSDLLQTPIPRHGLQGGEPSRPQSPLRDGHDGTEVRRWKPEGEGKEYFKPSPYDVLAHIVVEEATNFYFACLFHLGRVLASADARLDAIQRLLDPRNLESSAARVGGLLEIDTNLIRLSLHGMCSSESEYQSARRRFALDCWQVWREKVFRLQALLGSSAEDSVLASEVGAGVCFVICSRDKGSLLERMGPDQTLFSAMPSPSVSQRLQVVASFHADFVEAFSTTAYWQLVTDSARKFDEHFPAIPDPKRPSIQERKWDGAAPKDFVSEMYKYKLPKSQLAKPRYTPFYPLADIRMLMCKMTKLFIVNGSKPPIWPAAKHEAKRAWVANALFRAEVDAEFLINNFAEQLLRFSAEVSERPGFRFPFADSEWNAYLDSFFNMWWVPNLRHQLNRVDQERFDTLVLAAARLLSTMGYSVHAASEAKVPPGAGEKRDSDQFPKGFDVP